MYKFLKSEKISVILIIIGITSLIIFIIFFLWNDVNFSSKMPINADKVAHFGDFVGGFIGSIWSLAGVLLFYLALTEQRKDFDTNQGMLNVQVEAFNQQIEEFKLQRVELESSRKIYEEQSKTLQIQQFESNFYSLLNVYLTIKERLPIIEDEQDYFKYLYQEIQLPYDLNSDLVTHELNVIQRYVDVFNKNSGQLSHYFKSFYRIIRIIDSHFSLTEEEKVFYTKIVRSQLTDYEQILLYYNSHTIYGEKARPLILKYDLLKHAPNFKRTEFEFWYNIQNNSSILLFASWMQKFLAKNIPYYYDINFEKDKIEENCEYFNCIVGIYFGDKLEIKIYCDPEIAHNGINLSEAEFSNFVYCLLIDRIQLKGYIKASNIKFEKFITTSETNKIFGFEIESVSKIEI